MGTQNYLSRDMIPEFFYSDKIKCSSQVVLGPLKIIPDLYKDQFVLL